MPPLSEDVLASSPNANHIQIPSAEDFHSGCFGNPKCHQYGFSTCAMLHVNGYEVRHVCYHVACRRWQKTEDAHHQEEREDTDGDCAGSAAS